MIHLCDIEFDSLHNFFLYSHNLLDFAIIFTKVRKSLLTKFIIQLERGKFTSLIKMLFSFRKLVNLK